MARLVAALAASHAPSIVAAPETAPPAQKDRIYAAMTALHREVTAARATVAIVCANEHFTNFFLDNFPPFCIGVADRYTGPAERWLRMAQTVVPGHQGLGRWLLERALAADFDPAFSEDLRLDHGIMAVLHFLSPGMDLPVVPIVQNCAVKPMPTLRRCFRFGGFLREAIEAWPADERVAIVGTGGLSHWVGTPGMGRVNAEFDRWFLDRLAAGRVEEVLALSDAEIERAGNGAHEIRSWITLAGAMGGIPARPLAYEPVPEWVTGMAMLTYGPIHDR
jgi:protocatechuate 4,5-dioxygenase beta chain